jgi:6-phosphogluconate dehydrogenase
MHEVFAEWNKANWIRYLIEITRDILAVKDTDGAPLVDKILDTAGQKGTGKWTVINSQDLGIPITLMAEAVYSRCVSALKDERVKAARKLKGPRRSRASPRSAKRKRRSSMTSATRFTPRRSSATRRVTCSCARRRRNTNGT